MFAKCLFYMVRSDGVEPPTYWFVASCYRLHTEPYRTIRNREAEI